MRDLGLCAAVYHPRVCCMHVVASVPNVGGPVVCGAPYPCATVVQVTGDRDSWVACVCGVMRA